MHNSQIGTRRFDLYLENILAADLKPMTGLWAKASKLCRDDCVKAVRMALADPDRVSAALAKLTSPHRTGLAFIREAGGELAPECLEAAMIAAGHVPPGQPRFSNRDYPWCEALIKRGIALMTDLYHPTSVNSYNGKQPSVFTDERLLKHVAEPDIARFDIEADMPANSGMQRSSGSVVLDIIAVLQAIEKTGVRFTQSGMPHSNDANKIRKELHWSKVVITDGLPFPGLAEAVVSALRAIGLLVDAPSGVRLAASAARFSTRSPAKQIRPFLHGFTSAVGWLEEGWCGQCWNHWRDIRTLSMRHALLTALRALPPEPSGFFSLDRFSEALFDRVGDHLSLGYHTIARPYTGGISGEELQRQITEWRDARRYSWRKFERHWSEKAFRTWLYWLGVVELAMEGDKVAGFRLTDLGRELFRGAKPEKPGAKRKSVAADAWIIQPDFGLMVYIDKASPAQMAFAERIAERQGQAQRHVAHYVLTRKSVYGALESGYALEDILAELRKGSERTLPANIETEIRDWSERREQIVLRRHAALLEFTCEADRQAAMTSGTEGVEVGDRFLLLTAAKGNLAATVRKVAKTVGSRFDYSKPLPPCINVRETGMLRLSTSTPDLLIRNDLDMWCERIEEDRWKLTEKSVQAAMAQGGGIAYFRRILHERALNKIPLYLQLAIKAWTAETINVQLANVSVLRCTQPDTFHAIASAAGHKDCLLGRLSKDTFLVDTLKLNKLQKSLRWAGIKINTEVLCIK